jgi:hypothetical protein
LTGLFNSVILILKVEEEPMARKDAEGRIKRFLRKAGKFGCSTVLSM